MVPFDSEKYFELQTRDIIARMRQFYKGKLYLEIGGKFLYDEHAERVLPGFDPLCKVKIIEKIGKPFDLIFCINSKELEDGRVWKPGTDYQHSVLNLLTNIKLFKLPKPKIVFNMYQDGANTNDLITKLKYHGYSTYKRYEIPDYSTNPGLAGSDQGFGRDEYVPLDASLVVVLGMGSNSGKLSTAMGQIYHETKKGIDSGYAKFEVFPVSNLPAHHPLNLAYEAATIDFGDKVIPDHFHKQATGLDAVNYHRDIECFANLQNMIKLIVSQYSQMRAYKSPTQMEINNTGMVLSNEELIVSAAVIEIRNRIKTYKNMGTPESQRWAIECEQLLAKAEQYTPHI